MSGYAIRPLTFEDRIWVRGKIIQEWGAEIIFIHHQVFRPAELPGFAACAREEILGLLTYRMNMDTCEIMTLNSWQENSGVGSTLIETVRQVAIRGRCHRLFLVTTNDNTNALRFYQKRGFIISTVRLNVMEEARRIKTEIPSNGMDGIPIRDEIELEILL
jgi:hypothetical protein